MIATTTPPTMAHTRPGRSSLRTYRSSSGFLICNYCTSLRLIAT